LIKYLRNSGQILLLREGKGRDRDRERKIRGRRVNKMKRIRNRKVLGIQRVILMCSNKTQHRIINRKWKIRRPVQINKMVI